MIVKGAASQKGRAWLLLVSLPADSTTVIAWSKYKYYFVIPGTHPVIPDLIGDLLLEIQYKAVYLHLK